MHSECFEGQLEEWQLERQAILAKRALRVSLRDDGLDVTLGVISKIKCLVV